jgi:hypothetical protein
VVHLRLGDLVNLGTKGPISPKRVVESVPLKFRDGRVLILSDSGKSDVDQFLSVESSNFSYEAYCLDLKNTFQYSVASRCFVGTNSKISIWTILLRILLEPERETLVPFELKDNIGKLTKEIKDAHKSIRFY